VFTLHGAILYQPEEDLVARLPGGSTALAKYLGEVRDTLQTWYQNCAAASRGVHTLVLAVSGTGRVTSWLLPESPELPSDPSLDQAFESLNAPTVTEGAIVVGLQYSLDGQTRPLSAPPAMPREWSNVARRLGGNAHVEQIVLQIWKDRDTGGAA
jgi:hypothetical protein